MALIEDDQLSGPRDGDRLTLVIDHRGDVEELDLAALEIDPSTVGWAGARQEITEIADAPAREAGEVIVDEGEAHERIMAVLDELKVL